MTQACMKFVAQAIRETGCSGRVLECGSYNVNGSVRHLFDGFQSYTGIDMREGLGVDEVCSTHQLPFSSGVFGVVVTTEMLEHDPCFWLSFKEMARVLQPGGFLIVTTRGIEYPRHDYPSDYYRFTADALKALFEWSGLRSLCAVEDEQGKGVFGYAVK